MDTSRWITSAGLRLRTILRRDRVEAELDEELAYHVDQLTARHLGEGLTAADARVAALKALGGLAYTKEICRDTRRTRFLEDVLQDVKGAIQSMRRQPAAAAVTLLTFAIGIGVTTAAFSIVNGVMLRKAYPDVERIMWVLERTPRGEISPVSAQNFFDWRDTSQSFDALSTWGFGSVTLSDRAAPVPLRAAYISHTYFDVFGIVPEVGRRFSADEERPGREHVALISHDLWVSQFGSDRAVVGRGVRLRGEAYTIIGVLPREASTGEWSWTQVWVPQVFDASNSTRSYRTVNVYGRLRRGVTVDQARAEMSGIAAQLATAYPDTNRGWGIAVTPYTDVFLGNGIRQSLVILLAAVAVLLLIACVNLANLLLVRALAREQECAIRAALGGGRGRLVRQVVTESLVMASVGGGAGLLLASVLVGLIQVMLPAFSSPGPGHLPPGELVAMDARVYLFAFALSAMTAILCSLISARSSIREDLVDAVRRPGELIGRQRVRLRSGLVVAEVALAFLLLATAGVLVEGYVRLQRVETGFDATNVFTAQLLLTADRATGDPRERTAYMESVLKSVRSLPSVSDAALTSVLPLQGWGSEMPFQLADQRPLLQADRPTAFLKMVTPEYFSALRLALRRGRLLGDHDDATSVRVAVINETMARTHFAGRDPIGQRLLVPEIAQAGRARFGNDLTWEIVGVIADERVDSVRDTRISPGLYVTLAQSPTRRPSLVVRTAGTVPAAGIEAALRRAVADVNSDQPLAEFKSLRAIKDDLLVSERQQSMVVTVFAAVALLLAAVGLYGVMACVVLQRRHELGIRAAIGARAGQLASLVLRDGMTLVGVGLAVGLVMAGIASYLLSRQIASLSPGGIGSWALAALVLLVVGATACLVPARRAMTANPLWSLKAQ